MILVFLIYGNGFANSADLLNVFGVNSIGNELSSFDTSDPIKDALIVTKISVNNDLCEIRSRSCFDNAYLIHTESKKHTHCAKLFYSYQEMKTFGMETIYDTPMDPIEVTKTTNNIPFVAAGSAYLSPINLKFKRLQNLNIENYMSQPINPSYTRGFGVRLKL